MDINANRELGKLVNDAIYDRFTAAGYKLSQLSAGMLWEVTQANVRFALAKNTTLEQASTPSDLQDAYLNYVHTAMAYAAILKPEDARAVVVVIPEVQKLLQSQGCKPLTQSEFDTLAYRMMELVAQPTQPGTLGAMGAWFKHMVTRSLRSLPVNKAGAPRRRRFLQAARALYLEIEESPNFADRRAHGFKLGELLERELLRSGSANIDVGAAMAIFWSGFKLLVVEYPLHP